MRGQIGHARKSRSLDVSVSTPWRQYRYHRRCCASWYTNQLKSRQRGEVAEVSAFLTWYFAKVERRLSNDGALTSASGQRQCHVLSCLQTPIELQQ